jgi:hypothetical protein
MKRQLKVRDMDMYVLIYRNKNYYAGRIGMTVQNKHVNRTAKEYVARSKGGNGKKNWGNRDSKESGRSATQDRYE